MPCFYSGYLFKYLVLLDDLGLHRFTPQRPACLYKLTLNRHRAFSLVITSNRGVGEWLSLFDAIAQGHHLEPQVRQEQAGIGRQRRCEYGRGGCVVASIGCSLFLAGFLSRKPLSQIQRSTI